MEVHFTEAVYSPDPSVLLQEMVKCQNEIITEYNEELNTKTEIFRYFLQKYLNRNHPGLATPTNGPHFQFVENSLEVFAFLSLELDDLLDKLLECSRLKNKLYSKIKNYQNADARTPGKKKDILKSIHDSVSVIYQILLYLERQNLRLNFKYQKLRSLGMNADSPSSEDRHDHDVFLGVLRKGILSLITLETGIIPEFILSVFHDMWPKLNESLKYVKDELKLLELYELSDCS